MGPPHTDAVAEYLAASRAAPEKVNPQDREDTVRHLVAAAAALKQVHPKSFGDTVRRLVTARVAVDAALNEAMAQAALAGYSLRAVADMADMAPNSVAPRLARTFSLGGYGDPDGRVTAAGVQRARYDQQEDRQPSVPAEPLRFRRRENRGKQAPS